MNIITSIKNAFQEVYQSPLYWLVTVFSMILIFSFNALINNYRILVNDFSFPLLWSLWKGAFVVLPAFSLVVLLCISLLGGIVISLSLFLIRRQMQAGIGWGSGIAVGVLAPACPSCAIGLASLLGLSGFFAVLPFNGRELGILGIGILLGSLFYLSNKVSTKTCDIK